jgi:2-amino-4-hydroxy-6-hydroxymethyldihydropteridine diphosphokinase
MTQAVIALGSNLGDRNAAISAAVDAISQLESTSVVRVSTLIETEPVGPVPQGSYLNGACVVDTELSARRLLKALLKIEIALGRERIGEQRWGPRTIDLDVLIYGDQIIDEPGLCIPHPRLSERLFVLAPLNELVPELLVPDCRQTVNQLYSKLIECGDRPCS